MRPALLVNASEALMACALALLGMIQAIDIGVAGILKRVFIKVLPNLKR